LLIGLRSIRASKSDMYLQEEKLQTVAKGGQRVA
jgi:hypothetical protein